MKQKYAISIDRDKNRIIIREFAELEKDEFSLLCQEEYASGPLEEASKKGLSSLVTGLRTVNMYPSGLFAEKIALAVQELLQNDATDQQDLYFDDIEAIGEEEEEDFDVEEEPEDDDGYDDLLDGDDDDADTGAASSGSSGGADGDEEDEDPLD